MLKGSILSKVRIVGCDDDSEVVTSSSHENNDIKNNKGGGGKRKHNENNEDDCVSTDEVYVTRFLESSGSSSFLIVRIQSILKRYVCDDACVLHVRTPSHFSLFV